MRVSPQNVARFYHIWLALLNYVNAQLHLDLDIPKEIGAGPISTQVIQQLRNSLWAHDDVRERFVAENPAHLAAEDLAIVASWDYRVADTFSIVRHLKKYTLFLSHTTPAHVYGVLGLVSTIASSSIPNGSKMNWANICAHCSIGCTRMTEPIRYRQQSPRDGLIWGY